MGRQSLLVEAYYPEQTRQIIERINRWPEDRRLILVGFGEDMKWLCRILGERIAGICDWRPSYAGFDVGSHNIQPLQPGHKLPTHNAGLVICLETLPLIEGAIRIIVQEPALCELPVLWNTPSAYDPCAQEPWARDIYEKARLRAESVNSKDRLFNLMQCVRETKNVRGAIVEFGSFAVGTASVIWETLQTMKDKRLLFMLDSFRGLPAHRLGVDGRWGGTFSNVSYAEIQARFGACPGIQIIDGNILDTVQTIDGPLSLVHIDVDTHETVEAVTSHVWPKLSQGGILLFDDYGFLPNCLPLKIWIDDFFKDKGEECFKFYLPSNGFLVRRNP